MVIGSSTRGFTLMEVLISLTIVGVLSLMVFTSLRLGARAWEKGEREIDTIYRERVVLNLVQEQLASMVTKNLAMSNKKPYYLVGNQERIEFLSTRQLIPGTEESVVKVVYQVQSDETTGIKTLAIKEEKILGPDNEKEKKEKNDDGFQLLIQGMHQISIEYLDTQSLKESESWLAEWNGNQNNQFPRAVRLRLYKGDFEYSTIIAQVFAGDLE